MSRPVLQRTLGTWVKLPVPETVQILAHAGFDFVVIDQEHAPIDVRTAYGLIAVADGLGLPPLVRVPDAAPSTIQRILDAGASGVLVPHVDSAAEAEEVVRAVRFPPRGRRGAGGTSRAGRWGTLPRDQYLAGGDERVLCIPQLESGAAVENAAAVAATDGVDALFVGAADLALDVDAAPGSDQVEKLCGLARDAAHLAGKPCGAATATTRGAAKLLDDGYDFVLVSNDTSMLAEAALSVTAGVREGTDP